MDNTNPSDESALEVMARFGKAFFKKDRGLLSEILTEDAQWHFAIGDDGPNGRVRVGVDGFLQGIAENDALFSRLKFNDVICRWSGDDVIVMTYTLDGEYRDGESFDLRGVELVTVRDNRVAKKDVFWKQRGSGGG